MKIGWTPELEAELQRVLAACPEHELAAAAQQDPAFQHGGFRAGKSAALRSRAAQLVSGGQPLSEALGRVVRAHSLHRPVVGVLAAKVLADFRNELAALFGGARLQLAMLVDERAEVRELATRWLQQETPFLALAPAEAAARLQPLFARLWEALGVSATPSAVPATREAWHDERQQLEQQLRDTRGELRRLKGLDDKYARQRDRLTALEQERAAAQARLKEAEAQTRAALREGESVRVELARELRHREERLQAAVEARLAVEATAWLTPARAELQTMRTAVEQLTSLGAFDAETVARLGATLAERLRTAYANLLPEAGGVDVHDDSPAGLLRRALEGRDAVILLMDGHNVLFGLQGRYLPPQGAAVYNAATRARLVEDVVRLAAPSPACRAWVVFDGPTRNESTPARNVRVTYSGGEGEHRADAALLDNIRFFRAGGEFPILLVTNDNDLASEARRLGAQTLSAREFGSFL
jgi:hypothetical protein